MDRSTPIKRTLNGARWRPFLTSAIEKRLGREEPDEGYTVGDFEEAVTKDGGSLDGFILGAPGLGEGFRNYALRIFDRLSNSDEPQPAPAASAGQVQTLADDITSIRISLVSLCAFMSQLTMEVKRLADAWESGNGNK